MEDAFSIAKFFSGLGDPLDWPLDRFNHAIRFMNDRAEDSADPDAAVVREQRRRWERQVARGKK